MLSPTELAAMQAMQALALPDVATITRRTYADDGAGGSVESVTTSVRVCRVAAASAGQVQMLGGRFAESQVWRVTFVALADVRKDDRVDVLGKSLEVAAVLGALSRETARVTLCTERV